MHTARTDVRPSKSVIGKKPQLVRMLRRKITLQHKYDLTDTPIRSVKEILAAEGEYFTKVWYGRKGTAKQYRAEGTPEDIIRGMLKAKREAEERFGKKNLGPWSDFEWGMLSGNSPRFVGFLEMTGTCSTPNVLTAKDRSRRCRTNLSSSTTNWVCGTLRISPST